MESVEAGDEVMWTFLVKIHHLGVIIVHNIAIGA
jgi:hypothetical protein